MATIYLSGGFYDTYKDAVRAALADKHELIDPERGKDIPGRYVGRDLDDIDRCGIVLAVQTDYPFVYGMAAEVGYAVALSRYRPFVSSKPDVIYVCLTGRVDSFLAGLARAVFTSVEAACEFINVRYN